VRIVIDDCPAGLTLTREDFSTDLRRRQPGIKGTTPRREKDIPLINSGLLNQKTTGAPLLITFENKDVKSSEYLSLRDTPRPGHADFVAHYKYGGFNDYRGGGHFSGRLTVAPELLINAVSLQNTIKAFESATPYLPDDCIISDVASVKGKIPEFYKKELLSFCFCSSHVRTHICQC